MRDQTNVYVHLQSVILHVWLLWSLANNAACSCNEIRDCIGNIAAKVWTKFNLSENQLSERQKHTLVTQDCTLIWENVALENLKKRYYLT